MHRALIFRIPCASWLRQAAQADEVCQQGNPTLRVLWTTRFDAVCGPESLHHAFVLRVGKLGRPLRRQNAFQRFPVDEPRKVLGRLGRHELGLLTFEDLATSYLARLLQCILEPLQLCTSLGITHIGLSQSSVTVDQVLFRLLTLGLCFDDCGFFFCLLPHFRRRLLWISLITFDDHRGAGPDYVRLAWQAADSRLDVEGDILAMVPIAKDFATPVAEDLVALRLTHGVCAIVSAAGRPLIMATHRVWRWPFPAGCNTWSALHESQSPGLAASTDSGSTQRKWDRQTRSGTPANPSLFL